MSEARARISLADGVHLEFEGSETFVNGQLDKFSRMIHGGPAVAASAVVSPPAAQTAPPKPTYEDIFAVTEHGVQILKTMPGDSRAQKANAAAKLYLYGLQALKQRDTAMFQEIAAVCRAHRCYDPSNMAASLKNDVESFVFGGRGKKQTL
jgi:hypothetical protein